MPRTKSVSSACPSHPERCRSLPTADVGSPVAKLEGQLSGGEIVHPAVAGRPTADTCLLGISVRSTAIAVICLVAGERL